MKKRSNKVLMITYVFPPMAYVGAHRTIRFCKYLPHHNWTPYVLTIKEAEDIDNDYELLKRIPKQVHIYRTRTIDLWRIWNKHKKKKNKSKIQPITSADLQDTKKTQIKKLNLLKKVKFLLWEIIMIPDHMVFWIPFAFFKGIRIIKKEKCDLIYTSTPPHSAQIIGFLLAKLCKTPWVADFRDPILDGSKHPPPKHRLLIDKILERVVVYNADKVFIISNYFKRIIYERYPDIRHKFITFTNGYDPDIFSKSTCEQFDKFTIIYSGSFLS